MKSTLVGAIHHGVPVPGFCVSSNHVHVVIHAEAGDSQDKRVISDL